MAANKGNENKEENDYRLKLYPLDGHEFIGTIWMDKEEHSNSIPTFVLLDSSNSMGDATRRIVNEIIPLVVTKLSYGTLYPVHLITFGKETTHHELSAEGFKSLFRLYTGNSTRMAPAIQRLHNLFPSLIPNKPIRILSITDGKIGDHVEAEMEVKRLMRFLDSSYFSINSQTVRLFTSESQPDTKALCYMLQINNTTKCELVDINATESNEIIATKIASLFQSDNFSHCKIMEMEQRILLKFPWESITSAQVIIVPGLNLFWLKLSSNWCNEDKIGAVKIGNKSIKVVVQNQLTLTEFQDLMETKLVNILDRMKILKIFGTDEANKSVDEMLTYFESKENKLAERCSTSTTKKITILLGAIANDTNVNKLDSAGMAEYLRDTCQMQSENSNVMEDVELATVPKIDVNSHSNTEGDDVEESPRKQEADDDREMEEVKLTKKLEDECQGEKSCNKQDTEDRPESCMNFVFATDADTENNLDSDAKSGSDSKADYEEEYKTEAENQSTQEVKDLSKREEKEETDSTVEVDEKQHENLKPPDSACDSTSMATNQEKQFKMLVYPLDQSEFIGTIRVDDDDHISNLVHTVILLDRSNNMGDETVRFTNEIIPLVLSKLSYTEYERVHFLTFASYSVLKYLTVDGIKSLSSEIYGRERTRLASAIKYVHSIFPEGDDRNEMQFNVNNPVRILIISAGGVEDYDNVTNNSSALLEFLYASDFAVNSQAVKLITSRSQPDTKALCSLLQMNNMTTSRILNIDAKESNETIATAIAQVFVTDNFSKSKILRMEKEIILKFPWNWQASSQIMLVPGLNLFWLKELPTGDITITNKHVDIVMQHQLTLTKFQDLMQPKLPYIVDHINILKVLDTVKANETVNSIIKYFATKEDKLAESSDCSSVYKKMSSLLVDTANGNNIKEQNSGSEMVDKPSENVNNFGPAIGNNLRVSDEKESEDSPAIVKSLQDIGGERSENVENLSPLIIVEKPRDIDGKQIESIKSVDTPVVMQDVYEPSERIYSPLNAKKFIEQFRHLNYPVIVESQEEVSENELESVTDLDLPPGNSLPNIRDKQSENIGNLANCSPNVKNIREVDGYIETHESSARVKDMQLEIQKQPEFVKNVDSAIDKSSGNGDRKQSENSLVIVESLPAVGGNQAEDMEKLESSTLMKVLEHEGEKQSEMMKNIGNKQRDQSELKDLSSPAAVNKLRSINDQQPESIDTTVFVKNLEGAYEPSVNVKSLTEHFKSFSSPANVENHLKVVREKESDNVNNLDLPHVNNLRDIDGNNQSKNMENLNFSPIVKYLRDVGSNQTDRMENPYPVIGKKLQDGAAKQSESWKILTSPAIVKNLQSKQLENMKNNESSVHVKDTQGVGEKQPGNLDTPVNRNERVGVIQSENAVDLQLPANVRILKDDSMESINLPVKHFQEVGDFENMKELDLAEKGTTRNVSVIGDEQAKIFTTTARTLEEECENQSSTGSTEDEHESWKNSDVSTPERQIFGNRRGTFVNDLQEMGEYKSDSVDPPNVESVQFLISPAIDNIQKLDEKQPEARNIDTPAIVGREQSKEKKNFEFSSLVEEIKDVGGEQSANVENLDTPAIVMNLRGVDGIEQSEKLECSTVTDLQYIGENRGLTIDNNLRDGEDSQLENEKYPRPTNVKKLRDIDGKQSESFNMQQSLDLPNGSSLRGVDGNQSENMENLDPAIVENQRDGDDVKILQDVDGKQPESTENVDTPVIVKKIQSGADRQSDSLAILTSPTIVQHHLPEACEKQSEHEKHLDKPTDKILQDVGEIMKKIDCSALVKDLQDNVGEQMEYLNNPALDKNIRSGADMQSESREHFDTREIVRNSTLVKDLTPNVIQKIPEFVKNVDLAIDKEIRNGAYSQPENVKIHTAPEIVQNYLQGVCEIQSGDEKYPHNETTVKNHQHIIGDKQSDSTENVDTSAIVRSVYEQINSGDKQSENVTRPVIVENLQDTDGKQSQNMKHVCSPGIAINLQDVGEEQSEHIKENADFPVVAKNLLDVEDKYLGNFEDLDLAEKGSARNISSVIGGKQTKIFTAETLQGVGEIQSRDKYTENKSEYNNTVDPPNVESLRDVCGTHLENLQILTSPAIVRNIQKMSEKQAKDTRIGEHFISSPANVENLEVVKESENVKSLDLENVTSPQTIGGKQSESMENVDFSPIVKNLREIGSNQSERMEHSAGKEPRDVDDTQSESIRNVDAPEIIERLPCMSEPIDKYQRDGDNNKSENSAPVKDLTQNIIQKQSQYAKNLHPSIVTEKRQGVDTQSENWNNLTSPAIVKNARDVVSKLGENMKNLGSSAPVKDSQDVGEKQSENIDFKAHVNDAQDGSHIQSENFKNDSSPEIVTKLKQVSEKQPEHLINIDPVNNHQDVGAEQSQNMKNLYSLAIAITLRNINGEDENQSQHMENIDFPNVFRNTAHEVETNFENLDRECRYASNEKVQEVSVKESENEENIDSPSHAMEAQDVGEKHAANVGGEQSENRNEKVGAKQTEDAKKLRSPEIVRILQNVDLPAKNLQDAEHLENIELAEKGMVLNIPVTGEEQSRTFTSTAKTLEEVGENLSEDNLTGSTEDEHDSGNGSYASTPERGTFGNRRGTFVVVNDLQEKGKYKSDSLDARSGADRQSENVEIPISTANVNKLRDVDGTQSESRENFDKAERDRDVIESFIKSLRGSQRAENSTLMKGLTQNVIHKQPKFVKKVDSTIDKRIRNGADRQPENYLQDLCEKQSEDDKTPYTETTVNTIQGIGGKKFESMEIVDTPAIVRSLKRVCEQTNSAKKESENRKHPTIAINIQDVGEGRSQYFENLDGENLQDADGKYLENMKDLDLAEKGIARNVSAIGEQQSRSFTSTAKTLDDVGENLSVDDLTGSIDSSHESGNCSYAITPESGISGNRRGTFVVVMDRQDEKMSENNSYVDSPNVQSVPDICGMHLENLNVLTSPAIAKDLEKLSEKQSEDASNLPAIINILQDVGSDRTEEELHLNFLSQLEHLKNLDPTIVKDKRECVDLQSENENVLTSPAIVENIRDFVSKQMEIIRNLDPAVGETKRKGDDTQSEYLKILTSPAIVKNLRDVVGKQSVNIRNLESSVPVDLQDEGNLENRDTPTARSVSDVCEQSAIVGNLPDIGVESIDLPAKNLHDAEDKYLENTKDLDLAEKGMSRSLVGEQQTKILTSTPRNLQDVGKNRSRHEFTGSLEEAHESGNYNNVRPAEGGISGNRRGTFLVQSVGETNDLESAVLPKTKNSPVPLLENDVILQVYPMDENEFIGTVTIEVDKSTNSVENIIVLDQSLSMKNATRRLTNEIIPLVLSKLSHDKSQPLHFITFAMDTLHHCVTPDEMKSLAIETHYGTHMAPCIQKVHSLLQTFDSKQPIRILSISDGEVQDRQETENAVMALSAFLNASDFSINSQAIRLVTSESRPDTKTLCNFLRINNTTTSQLVDIDAEESNEAIATQIADLFQLDNFSRSKILTIEKEIILKFPWHSKPSSQILLVPGLNVFWFNKIPTGEVKLTNSLVKMIVQNPLTLSKFQDLMETKLAFVADHMEILKIVDTTAANRSMDRIVKYFETREDKLAKYSNVDSACRKNISNVLEGIAAGDIKTVDPATLALGLRDAGQKHKKITESSNHCDVAGINDNIKNVHTGRLLQGADTSERSFPDGNVVRAEFVQEKRKTNSKANGCELQVHPVDENDFIASIRLEEDKEINSIVTVIILDLCVSIGRLTNEIIPTVLSKLSYDASQPVHLITFMDDAQHYLVTAEGMKSLKLKICHGSKMASVVQRVHSFFQSLNANEPIRLLTITDAEFQDHKETEEATKALLQFLDSSNFSINSQTVRLFTKQSREKSQRGAKTLCNLLQMNNTTKVELVDIDAETSSQTIATIISQLFLSDNFVKSTCLTMEEEIILKFPWNTKPSSEIILLPGLNVFWLKKVPTGKVKLRNSPVQVVLQSSLTLAKFQHLMEPKLVHIVDHIQILKVVDTVDGNETVDRILQYFKCTENKLAEHFSIGKYRKRDACSGKKISNFLTSIGNDEKNISLAGIVESPIDAGKMECARNLNDAERAEHVSESRNTHTEHTKSSNPRGDRIRRIWNLQFDYYRAYYVTFFIILLILVVFMLFEFLKNIF